MEQKRVSFKVAKAIKEAGYPQGETELRYILKNCCFDSLWYKEGELVEKRWKIQKYNVADAPIYTNVWFWLWREKKIEIELYNDGVGLTSQIRIQGRPQFFNSDPEDAVIAAIEYIVDNNLLK